MFFSHGAFSQVTYTWRYYLATADSRGFQNKYLVGMPSDSATNPTKRQVYMTLPGSGEDGAGGTLANAVLYGYASYVYNGVVGGGVTQSNGYADSVVYPIYVTTQRLVVANNPLNIAAQIEKFYTDYPTYADRDQLHIGGISLGGKSAMRLCVDSVSASFQKIVTSFWWTSPGSMDAVNITPFLGKMEQYHDKGGRIAFTTGETDASAYHYDTLNAYAPGSFVGRDWTAADGIGTTGHGGWGIVWAKQWDFLNNQDIVAWQSQFTIAPKAIAQDTINTSSNSVTLNGVSNGWYKTVGWSQISGPSASIITASQDTTVVALSDDGEYIFRMTVTNTDDARTATHDVVVNYAAGEQTIISIKPKNKVWFVENQ